MFENIKFKSLCLSLCFFHSHLLYAGSGSVSLKAKSL